MDASVLKLVIVVLAAICCLCILGIVLSTSLGHEIPPTLGSIASMVAGALVGILVTPAGANIIQKTASAVKQCDHDNRSAS
jgi:hypothetical protein